MAILPVFATEMAAHFHYCELILDQQYQCRQNLAVQPLAHGCFPPAEIVRLNSVEDSPCPVHVPAHCTW
jgi:hypothetical protein